jgi:hypothetical protein
LLARSLAPEDPSKNILFNKKLLKTHRETGISQTAYTPPISTSSVFFSAVKCENLFFDSGVSENTCFSRNLNHFSGHHPLTPLMHFGNFSLTVFLKKLKKEQFDYSYFYDSRYIWFGEFRDTKMYKH